MLFNKDLMKTFSLKATINWVSSQVQRCDLWKWEVRPFQGTEIKLIRPWEADLRFQWNHVLFPFCRCFSRSIFEFFSICIESLHECNQVKKRIDKDTFKGELGLISTDSLLCVTEETIMWLTCTKVSNVLLTLWVQRNDTEKNSQGNPVLEVGLVPRTLGH